VATRRYSLALTAQRRNSARMTICGLMAVLCWVPVASGQTFQTGSITFPLVEARASSPPEAGAEGLHWVASGLDKATVRAGDPRLKQLIEEWLARNHSAKHDWLLDVNTQWTLPEALFRELRAFEFQRARVDFLTRPRSTDRRPDVEFQFRFRLRPPGSPLTAIGIDVSTEGADGAGVVIELGQVAPNVSARGVVKADEAAPQTREIVAAALREVATQAWTISQQHGVVVGTEASEDRFVPVERAVNAFYAAEGNGITAAGRPQVASSFRDNEPLGKGRWTLFVQRVRVIRDVSVEVPLVAIDDQHGSEEEIARRRANADALKKRTEAIAREHLAPQLDALRNRVPTSAALHGLLKAAEADSALRPPASLRFEGSDMVMVARDAAPRYGFALAAEAGWSAESRLYGTGTFSGDNLMRLSHNGGRVESESAALSGLQDGWRTSGQWTLLTTRARPRGSVWKTGFVVPARLSFDRDQLFGNPAPTRLSFESRSLSPAYSVEYSSPTRETDNEPKNLRVNWKFKGGPTVTFGRVVAEEGFAVNPPDESRRYTAFVTFNEVLLSTTTPAPEKRGLGTARALVRVDTLSAGDFSKVGVALEGGTTFGGADSRDFLVRYQTGFEVAGNATPLFELPRLGGTARVRGLEDGEQLGRRVGYAQLTVGPSFGHVASWFGKKTPADARLGPIRLSDLYVVGFFDRGLVSDDASVSSLLWPSDAVGYGAAAEMQNLVVGSTRATLTIGYGRSPDSTRHTRGVAVVAVVIDVN